MPETKWSSLQVCAAAHKHALPAASPACTHLASACRRAVTACRCLFGEDVDTDEGYMYDIEHFDSTAPPAPTKTRQGKGDGTVNQLSLEACSK